MNPLTLGLTGTAAGIFFGIVVFRVLLKKIRVRMVLSQFVDWYQAELPPHCKQVVRHGKWVLGDQEDAQ
ncbi:MAG: hypothetical protein HC848_01825 [Limnobacter sp.]|nr:hypothetical protein [Limnobacter sp.]